MLCYHCQQPGHMRRDCPQRKGSRGLGTVQSQSAEGQEQIRFVSPYPSMGQRDQCQYEGASKTPSTSQMDHIGQGQSVGRGRPQNLQAESSGQAGQMTCYHCRHPGHRRRDCPIGQRSHGIETERSDFRDMQGTFLLSHLLTRVAFKLDAPNSFIIASYVIELGLEFEAFRETICGCSSLRCKVRVDLIGRDYELEISEILLMVDPRDWGVTVWHH